MNKEAKIRALPENSNAPLHMLLETLRAQGLILPDTSETIAGDVVTLSSNELPGGGDTRAIRELRSRLPEDEFESHMQEDTILDATTRGKPTTFHGLVGRSTQMLEVFARIEQAAAGDVNVCIYGESGTGKELIARAIHEISERRDGPLITFDCTAVPEGLAESQLFGHVRGAFTGAVEHREGVFSQANNGTLFIDELCELSPPLQAKLLRVIQSREFVKVGGTKPIRSSIRLVTATNKDPKQAVDAGAFRADLYYRVAVVMIRVPPLRERREDIPMLVEHFLTRYSAAYQKPIRGVQPSAMKRMVALPWPGNVRQLENFLAQAVLLIEGDMLTERDLFVEQPASLATAPPSALQLEPGLPLREVEKRHILSTLQRVQGNRTEAAKVLGISVRSLQYKLKKYAETSASLPGAEGTSLRPDTPTTREWEPQLETATLREWEPLRTNVSLGDSSRRHGLMFIGAVLFLLAMIALLAAR